MQNIPERTASEDEQMRRFGDNLSAKIRVAMPAKVVSFDAEKQTIVAQPLIREKIINRVDGSVQWVDLPQLLDVPVMFPQAGNFVLTMPISEDDEVLVIFNDMCIDGWWTSGGIQNWNDRRRHDLSDAIAIPGINSVPNVIPNIAQDAAELRAKDGSSKVRIQDHQLDLTAVTVNINATTTNLNAETINLEAVDIDMTATNIAFNASNVGVQVGDGSVGDFTINARRFLANTYESVLTATTFNRLHGGVDLNHTNYFNHFHGGVQNGVGFTGYPQT